VHDEETGGLVVFAVNRGTTDIRLDIDLRGLPGLAGAAHLALDAGADPDAVNTADDPDRVVPRERERPSVDAGRSAVRLAPASWNLIRYHLPPS
jgi:alpha-N-arabinofuranosidase